MGGGGIPLDDAKRLFNLRGDRNVYDEFTFYRYRGGLNEEVRWPEHPDGRFTRRTSREGFREDFNELPEKRDFLVVVAGDSQTDGLCSNSESFSNLAEARLSDLHPGSTIQVLNAGMVGYSFYNYLGTLRKLADSKPDVFVVAFYSGNDFKDLIVPWHYFHRSSPPLASPEYTAKLKEAIRISGSATAMALNRILYFKYEREEARIALGAAIEVCAEIQRLCRERGIALLFLHVPPFFRVRGQLPPAIAMAQEELGVSDEEMELQERMPDELIGTLRASGARVLDLRERFPDDISSFYWSDMHLSVKGHAFVAECLVPELDALFSMR